MGCGPLARNRDSCKLVPICWVTDKLDVVWHALCTVQVEYRRALAASFFFKFFVGVACALEADTQVCS